MSDDAHNVVCQGNRQLLFVYVFTASFLEFVPVCSVGDIVDSHCGRFAETPRVNGSSLYPSSGGDSS